MQRKAKQKKKVVTVGKVVTKKKVVGHTWTFRFFFFFFNFLLAFFVSLVSLLVGLEASGRTLHSLPDLLLLFCGKMLVTTNCYQSAGLPKGRDLKKKMKNLNWHHWTDFFVFVLTCQNLGLLGLVKEKKTTENNGLKTLDLMTNDRLDAPPQDSRRAVFWNVCGLCVLGQCGLASRTCAVASWVGGVEKWFVK